MLIWKTQTLNVNVASVRYRCLIPLKYLAQPLSEQGIGQTIVGGIDPVALTPETTAIIFVKSFRDSDVETCRQAHHLGTPIILDLCDNIFIAEYATDNDYVPAKNFRKMVKYAAAIVTTGEALKEQIETAIAPLNIIAPIVVIPDPSETQSDIDFALRTTRLQRLISLQVRPAQRKIRWAYGKSRQATKRSLKTAKRKVKATKKKVKATKRTARTLLSPVKRQLKSLLGLSQEKDSEDRPAKQQALVKPSLREIASTNHNDPPPSAHTQQATPQPIAQNKQPAKNRSHVQPTPWIPQKWPPAPSVTKTILWFGNHGAKYGSFGMESILEVAPAIENLSQELPLRLVVVSNSQVKYQRHIAPLPFETSYLRWHPQAIYDYIRASHVTIIPNSQSTYSICKSANRAVLSLSQGTPVVANRTPALDLFKGCIVLDDWEPGLRQYLLEPDTGLQHVAQAQRAIAQNLSGERIAQQWLSVLKTINTQTVRP